MIMTIYEALNENPKITNDFDETRAKVELSRLQKIYSLGGCAVAFGAQRLSNALSEYERRTRSSIENVLA